MSNETQKFRPGEWVWDKSTNEPVCIVSEIYDKHLGWGLSYYINFQHLDGLASIRPPDVLEKLPEIGEILYVAD